MAGRGPAPKRKNQRGTENWTRLLPLKAPVLPELDELGPVKVWPPVTRMLWDAWRSSPVTSTWAPEDIALAADTILLHDEDPIGRANEIRLRIDNLGLSPKGRRDARLLLPEDDELIDEQLSEPTPPRVLPEAK